MVQSPSTSPDIAKTSPILNAIRLLSACKTPHSDDSLGANFYLYSPIGEWDVLVECNGRVLYEGTAYPGMLRLRAPGDRERTISRGLPSATVLEIPGIRLQEIFERHRYSHSPGQFVFMQPILGRHKLVKRLIREAAFSEKLTGIAKQCLLDGLTEALIGLLIDNHQHPQRQRKDGGHSLTDEQMHLCVRYADAMLDKKVSLVHWSQSINLATAEFARRFHRRTGDTPYSWFMNRRIERAQELLKTSQVPLTELALQLGFSSQSHFSVAFRDRTRLSPSQWRASHA